MVCVTPLNTRIFAGNLVFGEFRAILRGVVVKKIHNFLRKEITVIYVIFLTCTDENNWDEITQELFSKLKQFQPYRSNIFTAINDISTYSVYIFFRKKR